MIAMLGWLTFTIPFAWWKGGAFETVFFKFSKGVVVAVLVSMIVTKIVELRKLLWVQAASLTLTTIISIILHNPEKRMGGVLGGIFQNPNDLAINIALNWPLCFVFFLLSKKAAGKLFWAGAMFVMVVGNFLTYSRSGFLSLILAAVICLWFFGVKGKRGYLLGIAAATVLLIAVAAPIFGLSGHVWLARMESIVATNVQDSHDAGSKAAREELLQISLIDMATHPMVGVGPGNFQAVSGHWFVAHNTYTELGAEGGLPALLLFLLFLGCGFRNLRRVSKSAAYKNDVQIQLFTGAMWASLFAFLLGAFFSDTQYELFPYFMVGYTTALYHLACVFPAKQGSSLPALKRGRAFDRFYDPRREPTPASTR
ncbi:MAG: O-antigen ligase family protein [Acidobacteriales bacterium]|nr:O-antigen ligase family protein [Terriglobales bacterium]